MSWEVVTTGVSAMFLVTRAAAEVEIGVKLNDKQHLVATYPFNSYGDIKGGFFSHTASAFELSFC